MTEYVLSLYRGLIERPPHRPTMREIAGLVAAGHGLTIEDLRGRSRVRQIVLSRQEAMALIRINTSHSLPKIGRFFNRDHTTVLHGIRAYRGRVQEARRVERLCG